jgi:hypothetical protein
MFSFTLPRTTALTAPYRIQADTFGLHNELCLSGGHAIKDTKGVWQLPMDLAKSNPRVQQYGVGKPVTYYHIECPEYFADNLIAEGMTVESFRNYQGSGKAYTWNEYINGYERNNDSKLWIPKKIYNYDKDKSIKPVRQVKKATSKKKATQSSFFKF